MKKVLLIGPGGSGKTTIAGALSAKTRLPLFHLDALYWRPGWEAMPKAEWSSLVDRLIHEPEWIMDGNYGGTLDQRLAACDTVVLLDMPPWLCLWRLLRRRLRHAGRSRPEMASGCPERLGAAFLWWVASYRIKRLPGILARLAVVKDAGKVVVVLRSAPEVRRFLSGVSSGDSHGETPCPRQSMN